MLEGRANADIFSIWFAHVRLDWARIIILDAPIGQILWCVRVEKVGRHFRHAFQVRDTSLRRSTIGEMFVAFLFVVFSGTISTIWRGYAIVHCEAAIKSPRMFSRSVWLLSKGNFNENSGEIRLGVGYCER